MQVLVCHMTIIGAESMRSLPPYRCLTKESSLDQLAFSMLVGIQTPIYEPLVSQVQQRSQGAAFNRVASPHESRICNGHTVGAETSRVFERKQPVKRIVQRLRQHLQQNINAQNSFASNITCILWCQILRTRNGS